MGLEIEFHTHHNTEEDAMIHETIQVCQHRGWTEDEVIAASLERFGRCAQGDQDKALTAVRLAASLAGGVVPPPKKAEPEPVTPAPAAPKKAKTAAEAAQEKDDELFAALEGK